MKKTIRVLVTLSIFASSLLFAQPASAIGTLYSPSTGNGDVACTVYGSFTIQNNVIIRSDEYCYGEVDIPTGVTAIAAGAFGYKNLSAISIPNTVTTIGEGAFQFSQLVSITIPDSVTSIGPGLFYNAQKLTTVILGNGITEIPDRAFEHTHGLTSVNIPNSVLSIGYGAFWAATSLTSITIPDSVTFIGQSAFQYMLALQSVVIGNGVTVIHNLAFSYLPSLTNLVIGNSVWYIGTYTFAGPNQLTSVTLPSSLSTLGTNAFSERENSSSANASLLSYKYCGTGVDASALSNAGLGSKTRLACPAAVTAGSFPNSQVATFATGITLAEIPATNLLPAIKLTFVNTPSSSVIVKPITNPAPLSATPFMTTGSPTIVDITFPGGHDGSDVKICLDGASTDNLYHFTGGQWVELIGRTYENNQVCGMTNSFSPFVAAPVNPLAPGIAPLFSTGGTYAGMYTVQITNYDPDTTYTATTTNGSASIDSNGLISVTGLGVNQSATVTVTTTKTGYEAGTGSVTGSSQVAPMLPSSTPSVALSQTFITCTIGSHSAAPTSAVFSLFVDGEHISTNFSAGGDYLPDWIIPWATSSSITRTASLTSATWAMSDAYKGKSITCTTLAYSNNATGLTSSQKMMVK